MVDDNVSAAPPDIRYTVSLRTKGVGREGQVDILTVP